MKTTTEVLEWAEQYGADRTEGSERGRVSADTANRLNEAPAVAYRIAKALRVLEVIEELECRLDVTKPSDWDDEWALCLAELHEAMDPEVGP